MTTVTNTNYRNSDNQSRPSAEYLNKTIDAINEEGLGANCAGANAAGAVTPDVEAHMFIQADSFSVPEEGATSLSVGLPTYGLRAGQAWDLQQIDKDLCKNAPHYNDALSCGVYQYRDVPANARTYNVDIIDEEPVDGSAVIVGSARYGCYPTIMPPPNGTEIGNVNYFGTEFDFFRDGTPTGDDVMKPYGRASLCILSNCGLHLPPLLSAIPDGCTILEARCTLSANNITKVTQKYDSTTSVTMTQTTDTTPEYSAQIVTIYTAGDKNINLSYGIIGSISGGVSGADCTAVIQQLYEARLGKGFIGWTALPTWSASGLAFALTQGDYSGILAKILPSVTWYGDPYAGHGTFFVNGAMSDTAVMCRWGTVGLSNLWVRYQYPSGIISEMQTPRDIPAADSIGAPFPGFH